MARLRLIIEIDAMRPRDANAVANVISDYADEQFEVYTMEHGRPMGLRSWIVKPNKGGTFKGA